MDAWMFGVPNSKGQIIVGRSKPHPLRKCWKDYPDDCSWLRSAKTNSANVPKLKATPAQIICRKANTHNPALATRAGA